MPFIGKQPETGAFKLIDSITTSTTATYALTVNSAAYFPESARNLIVSLNGVTQAPESAYTVSGSNIVFASALTASDVIDYILVIGDAVDIGTPSDNTVGTDQIASSVDLSGKTLTFANDQISGNVIDGGTISNFASTGIDDNATSTAITIDASENVGIGTSSPSEKLHIYNGNVEITSGTSTTSVSSITLSNSFDTAFLKSAYVNPSNNTETYLAFHTNTLGDANGTVAEQMRIAGNKVGIGTTSPSHTLHTIGSSDGTIAAFGNGQDNANILLQAAANYGSDNSLDNKWSIRWRGRPNAGGHSLAIYDEENSAERMRIDSSGNVGLGVAPSAWGSGEKAFQILGNTYGGGVFASGNNVGTIIGANAYWDGTVYKRINATSTSLIQFSGGATYFYRDGTGAANSNISFIASMTINNSGKVQIGTNNGNFTDALLTTRLAGNCIDWGHSNTAGYGSTLGSSSGSGAPFVGFSCGAGTTSNTFRTYGLKGSLITTDNAGALLFSRVTTATADNQSATESMRIDSSGNVGIGTVSPNALLHLGAASPHIDLGATGSNRGKVGYNNSHVYIGTTSSVGSIYFKNNISSTDAPWSSGDTKMIVGDGGITAFQTLTTSFAGNTKHLVLANTGATQWEFYSYNDGNLYINALPSGGSTATKFTITDSGEVGIGTSNPSYKLDVDVGAPGSADQVLGRFSSQAGTRSIGFVWDDSQNTLGVATLTNHNFVIHTNGTGSESLKVQADGNVISAGGLTAHNKRATFAGSGLGYHRMPVGHYTPGETVFEIDPTWTSQQLQDYFNLGSSNCDWVADSTAPGGYAIKITGNISVGGQYASGFPYIPIDTDDKYYMECYIKTTGGGTVGHYMGSNEYNESFSNLGGNPGSFGYWVMSNTQIAAASGWVKVSGYITGFGNSIGQFETGTKYWTPMALFNYTLASGTRESYISGWKVIRVARIPGDRRYSGHQFIENSASVGSGNGQSLYSGGDGIGLHGDNSYLTCGTHIELSTDATRGWANIYLNREWNSGEDARFQQFAVNGTVVGTIQHSGTSSTSYNTTSDYRLKENIVTLENATERLKQIPVRRFNFISDPDTSMDGFLAHEVSDYVPEAITGTKDETRTEEYIITEGVEEVVDEEGNVVVEAVEEVTGTREVPVYQGIDQSKLVPLMLATIKELEARISVLENN